MRSTARPLAVAAAAALVGGSGNAAFTLHDGSQSALTLTRFAVGLTLTCLWIAAVHPAGPQPARTRRNLTILAAAGAGNAASIVIIIAVAPQVSVLTLTILGLTTPALIALGARALRLPRATPAQAVYATVAVTAAAIASYNGSVTGVDSVRGVLLIATAALVGVAGTLASVRAADDHHPTTILAATCAAGTALALAAGVAGLGGGLHWGAGTLAVATYIAILPGGVAKYALLWAQARTAPHLVSAIGSLSILTAGALGWALLDQRPTGTALAASAIIAAAVAALAAHRPVDLAGNAGAPR